MADEDIPEKFRVRVVCVYAVVSETQARSLENHRGVIIGPNGSRSYCDKAHAERIRDGINEVTRKRLEHIAEYQSMLNSLKTERDAIK